MKVCCFCSSARASSGHKLPPLNDPLITTRYHVKMQGILADTTRCHQIPFGEVICARYMPSQRSKSSIPSQGIHRAGSEPCVFGKCPSRVRLINLVPHILSPTFCVFSRKATSLSFLSRFNPGPRPKPGPGPGRARPRGIWEVLQYTEYIGN